MRERIGRLWDSRPFQMLCLGLWVTAILLMPITSLPVIRKISGASTVAPPTDILFLLLALIWLFPFLLRRGKVPVEGIPLIFFIAVVVISWGAAFFIETPSYRGRNPLTEAPQAFVTMSIGLAVYFLTATFLSANQDRLTGTLRLLNYSGLVLIVWCLAQSMVVFYMNGKYPGWMMEFQDLLSSRRIPLFADRVTGMAYEPSWLAHQLNMLYLPIWLAATLCGFTAQKRRLWKFSLENFLLFTGVFVLFASLSRVGVITFLMVLAWLMFLGMIKWVKSFSNWIFSRLHLRSSHAWIASVTRVALTIILLVAITVTYLLAGVGLFYLGVRFDARLARILEQDFQNVGTFLEVTNKLAIAERVIYWAAGMSIFRDYPLLGVGLGNAGLYFLKKMPAYGWGLWEISLLFNYRTMIPNTKSLWVRILAESGLIGFAVFMGWYYLLWKSAWFSRQSKDPRLRMIGLAGSIVLFGFLLEGFSVDSYALPFFWFSVGLLSAVGSLARMQITADPSGE